MPSLLIKNTKMPKMCKECPAYVCYRTWSGDSPIGKHLVIGLVYSVIRSIQHSVDGLNRCLLITVTWRKGVYLVITL